MRSKYEGLLANAQMISGAAYDFSQSIHYMASHMMETFGQYMEGEVGNIFNMLAKVQFELSKLLDKFAAHVSQTIITPTDTIINEIKQVQVMKELYDEKRNHFNLLLKDVQKAKPKSAKGDSMNQLTSAREDFNEQAQILKFRLESVTEGQSHGLITQASRYHSAQMYLFSKGLASITAMEPVMRQLALEKNIDRSMSDEEVHNEVSLTNIHEQDGASVHGMESDSSTSSPTARLDLAIYIAPRKVDASSKSAPISSSAYNQKESSNMHAYQSSQSSRQNKISVYALPSPSNAGQSAEPSKQSTLPSDPNSTQAEKKPLLFLGRPIPGTTNQSSKVSGALSGVQDTSTEDNKGHHRKDKKLTPSMEPRKGMETKQASKISRSYSHSGSISNKPLLNSRLHGDVQSSTLHVVDSLSRTSIHTFPQNVPLPVSPQISELHKLPLPPISPNSAGVVGIAQSGPLGKKVHDATVQNTGPTSPLPRPPHLADLGGRSLSIPASSSRVPEHTLLENSN
ncbi:hypothetical protein KP509_10G006500 [Ceratopteris richardii]|uniref:BAR domain-containing protein n=1 Tax=Ceratopteris richardii TaxID=49495 RepID=A0A8T2TY39_CERRI|nr:hypothetical protein KP509_10G006500 [Ceratopteris richardii]